MKSIILLALTLFLISAPAPDSNDIAEITSNFIVPQDIPGLLAADELASENISSVQKILEQAENSKRNEQRLAANTELKTYPFRD